MKRKLNAEDIPVPSRVANEEAVESDSLPFHDLGLDNRLLQAIAEQNFAAPTPVQAKVIPLALAGKDILARSQTGSGKTGAYVLPILQSILRRGANLSSRQVTAALIIVPTRELAQQVFKAVASFSGFCAKHVRVVNLSENVDENVQRTSLSDNPDIVIATPAGAAGSLSNSSLSLDHVSSLVIDEADLVLSYGYDEDLQILSRAIPRGVQTTLMSATLTTDVNTLKGLFCRDPVVVDLQETATSANGITQYSVKCSEDDKFLLVYVIFKLKLVKGKCIIFVGDIDRCYRVKLFLEQFGVRSCVLNSELPVNSRIHIVEEFNKGVYDIIIASDEHEVMGEVVASRKSVSAKEHPPTEENDITQGKEGATPASPPKKKRKNGKRDQEYGVSRGIDFKNVAAVLNFDFPTSSKSYTHRIGRTARAGKTGMALSFIVPSELYHKHKSTTFPSAQHDEQVLQDVTAQQASKGKEVQAYHFDMKQVDAFRYRMTDALRAVTRLAIREARTTELRHELLKSEKLKRHFEENPDDLRHLRRNDSELRAARIQPHLKHVPDYLMPRNGKQGMTATAGEDGRDVGFVGLRKETDNRIRRARLEKQKRGKGGMGRKIATKRSDPLKTFNARGRGKK